MGVWRYGEKTKEPSKRCRVLYLGLCAARGVQLCSEDRTWGVPSVEAESCFSLLHRSFRPRSCVPTVSLGAGPWLGLGEGQVCEEVFPSESPVLQVVVQASCQKALRRRMRMVTRASGSPTNNLTSALGGWTGWTHLSWNHHSLGTW